MERFNIGDYAGFLEIFAPDVVSVSDPRVADRIEYSGHAGLRAWIDEALARWSAVRFSALVVEPAGSAVLVELAVVGETDAAGGAWRLHVLLHWTGDRVSRVCAYPDRRAALADAEGGVAGRAREA
jgi:hypothetical protein